MVSGIQESIGITFKLSIILYLLTLRAQSMCLYDNFAYVSVAVTSQSIKLYVNDVKEGYSKITIIGEKSTDTKDMPLTRGSDAAPSGSIKVTEGKIGEAKVEVGFQVKSASIPAVTGAIAIDAAIKDNCAAGVAPCIKVADAGGPNVFMVHIKDIKADQHQMTCTLTGEDPKVFTLIRTGATAGTNILVSAAGEISEDAINMGAPATKCEIPAGTGLDAIPIAAKVGCSAATANCLEINNSIKAGLSSPLVFGLALLYMKAAKLF